MSGTREIQTFMRVTVEKRSGFDTVVVRDPWNNAEVWAHPVVGDAEAGKLEVQRFIRRVEFAGYHAGGTP